MGEINLLRIKYDQVLWYNRSSFACFVFSLWGLCPQTSHRSCGPWPHWGTSVSRPYEPSTSPTPLDSQTNASGSVNGLRVCVWFCSSKEVEKHWSVGWHGGPEIHVCQLLYGRESVVFSSELRHPGSHIPERLPHPFICSLTYLFTYLLIQLVVKSFWPRKVTGRVYFLTWLKPIRWAKVRSKYILKPEFS